MVFIVSTFLDGKDIWLLRGLSVSMAATERSPLWISSWSNTARSMLLLVLVTCSANKRNQLTTKILIIYVLICSVCWGNKIASKNGIDCPKNVWNETTVTTNFSPSIQADDWRKNPTSQLNTIKQQPRIYKMLMKLKCYNSRFISHKNWLSIPEYFALKWLPILFPNSSTKAMLPNKTDRFPFCDKSLESLELLQQDSYSLSCLPVLPQSKQIALVRQADKMGQWTKAQLCKTRFTQHSLCVRKWWWSK